jgi:predicted nucleic acid-binding protein
LPATDLLERLHDFKIHSPHHTFCPETISLSSPSFFARHRLTSANLTDAYLLRTAFHAGAVLATLDCRILPAWIGEENPGCLEYLPV